MSKEGNIVFDQKNHCKVLAQISYQLTIISWIDEKIYHMDKFQ